MMFRPLRSILIACLILVPRFVQAQDSGQDPRVAAAKTACAAGDVQQAIRLLAELYTATNDPIWIFNQARCYHQQNQFPQAEARFKEFLRKNTNGPAEDNRDAQKYIDEIEAELHKSDSGGPGIIVKNKPEPAPQAGRGLRYAGIGCFALGGAGLALGVVFSLLEQKAESDIESQTKNAVVPYSAVSGKFSDGKLYANLQWLGYGVGAGAILTGGVLYYLGASKAATNTTFLAPLPVASGAGAILYHAF